MLQRKLGLAIIFVVLMSPAAWAATAPAMYFHTEAPLSPYVFTTVEISADGRLTCEVEYGLRSRTHKSTLPLTKQELLYFRSQFARVLSLSREHIETMGTDTGTTTWRMTEEGKTRELSYQSTDDPWCQELSQEMRRIASREAAFLQLLPEANQGHRRDVYDVAVAMSSGAIFHPETLREPLLSAVGLWPVPAQTFDRNQAILTDLLHALAYTESKEQWAGDVEEFYASRTKTQRITVLRTLSSWNFLTDLRDRQGRFLVPVLVKGVEELVADSQAGMSDGVEQTLREAVIALGNLRDGRAVDALSSDRLWALKGKSGLAGAAARGLTQIGLPGVEALLSKAARSEEHSGKLAAGTLRYAVQFYTFQTHLVPPEFNPTPEEANAIRQLLEARGYKQIEKGQLPTG